MKLDNSKCPNCKKKAFHMLDDWTSAKCDKCGFEIDYKKMPILKDMMDFIGDFKKAIKLPIDLEDEVDE